MRRLCSYLRNPPASIHLTGWLAVAVWAFLAIGWINGAEDAVIATAKLLEHFAR